MKKILKYIMGIILVISLGFIIWTMDYYKAENIAKDIYDNDNLIIIDNNIILKPNISNDKAIIFYPGGKVEYYAYLPLLEKLKDQGYTIVSTKMLFNLAFFDINKADKAFDLLNEEIKEVYIMGHSLGGVAASIYASDNISRIDGLIVLGSYVYSDYPKEKSLTIYGELDDVKNDITYDTNVIEIKGGNHANFGNYGKQKGDNDATIDRITQQNITVEAINEFINHHK